MAPYKRPKLKKRAKKATVRPVTDADRAALRAAMRPEFHAAQADKEEKRPVGRPPIEFDDAMRKRARSAAGYGLKDEQIAELVGVSERTLQRACAGELKSGRIDAKANIAQTAYQMAASGKFPAMTIFWLKTQCGWKDKTTLEHTGTIEHRHDLPKEERLDEMAEMIAAINRREAIAKRN